VSPTGVSVTGPGVVRLVAGVRRVRRPGCLLLLPPSGRPVVTSPLVDELWDALVSGTPVVDLVGAVQAGHPRARDVGPKLVAFLDVLWGAGLLEGSPGAAGRPLRVRLPMDPLARYLADGMGRLPAPLRAWWLRGAVAAAGCGWAAALLGPRRLRLSALRLSGVPTTVPAIALLVFLHELGHAVACRLVGVPSGPLCVPRGGVLPRVHTPAAWGVEDPLRRATVPAAGPLVDLLLGGCAAGVLAVRGPDRRGGPTAALVALYALVAVDVGTSPLPVGDGSHALEALLDDEFARAAALSGRRSRFTRPRSVLRYRLACLGHAVGTAALVHRLR
jgi:hypothetical protein